MYRLRTLAAIASVMFLLVSCAPFAPSLVGETVTKDAKLGVYTITSYSLLPPENEKLKMIIESTSKAYLLSLFHANDCDFVDLKEYIDKSNVSNKAPSIFYIDEKKIANIANEMGLKYTLILYYSYKYRGNYPDGNSGSKLSLFSFILRNDTGEVIEKNEAFQVSYDRILELFGFMDQLDKMNQDERYRFFVYVITNEVLSNYVKHFELIRILNEPSIRK